MELSPIVGLQGLRVGTDSQGTLEKKGGCYSGRNYILLQGPCLQLDLLETAQCTGLGVARRDSLHWRTELQVLKHVQETSASHRTEGNSAKNRTEEPRVQLLKFQGRS